MRQIAGPLRSQRRARAPPSRQRRPPMHVCRGGLVRLPRLHFAVVRTPVLNYLIKQALVPRGEAAGARA